MIKEQWPWLHFQSGPQKDVAPRARQVTGPLETFMFICFCFKFPKEMQEAPNKSPVSGHCNLALEVRLSQSQLILKSHSGNKKNAFLLKPGLGDPFRSSEEAPCQLIKVFGHCHSIFSSSEPSEEPP